MQATGQPAIDPTVPVGLPVEILSGLSSTEPGVQRPAVSMLRSFVDELFFYRFDNYFYISTLTAAGIIAFLFLIGLLVVLHRLYHGRLAPFRFVKRTHGFYVVPNAINCFLLFGGAYAVAGITFNLTVWKAFHDHMIFWVRLFPAFQTLLWLPLIVGAYLTGWGSLYIARDAMDKLSSSPHKTFAKRHLLLSTIINLSCWGTPVILTFSLLVPVSLSCVRLGNAIDRQVVWKSQLQALLDSTPADALLGTESLVDSLGEATNIFNEWRASIYYVDIAYIIWSFWALLFLVFYIPAGGQLVHLVFRQVWKQRNLLHSYRTDLEIPPVQDTTPMRCNVSIIGTARQRQNGEGPRDTTLQPTSRMHMPLKETCDDRGVFDSSSRTGGLAVPIINHQEMVDADKPSLNVECKQKSSTTENNSRCSTKHADQATSLFRGGGNTSLAVCAKGTSNFVSPTARTQLFSGDPQRVQPPAARETDAVPSYKYFTSKRTFRSDGSLARYKYLRRCLANLVILYVSIISATCCLGCAAVYLAVVGYRYASQGPDEVARSLAIAGTAANCVSAVFGVLTMGTVVFHNFDKTEREAIQHRGEVGGILRRSHPTTCGSPEIRSECHDQAPDLQCAPAPNTTRMLLTVPESVDLESPEMSMLRSQSRTSMRFSVSNIAGGLVMRPVDQLA